MLEILVLNHEDINISRVQWYKFCKNAFAKSLPIPNTVTATTFAQLGEIIIEGEFLFSCTSSFTRYLWNMQNYNITKIKENLEKTKMHKKDWKVKPSEIFFILCEFWLAIVSLALRVTYLVKCILIFTFASKKVVIDLLLSYS